MLGRWAGWRGPLFPMTLPSRAPSTFFQHTKLVPLIQTRESTPDVQLLCCLPVTASSSKQPFIKASRHSPLNPIPISLVPRLLVLSASPLRTEMLHSGSVHHLAHASGILLSLLLIDGPLFPR